MYISNSTLCCHWCGTPLGSAAKVTYLNGNLPVCDLCLITAKDKSEWADLYSNQKPTPPEFTETVDKHFWEII